MKPLYVKKNGTVNKVSGVAMPNTYPADRVGYDNTASELEATNTQDAIDEVVDIVADKVDKVTGKGLSTNDYDNIEKEQNTANASAIEAIVNVYGGKNLLVYPYYDGNSKTSGTITYTVDEDGVVSANGNTSSGTYYDFITASTGAKLDEYGLKIGHTYTLTGGIANKAYIYGTIRDSSNNTIMNITNNNSNLSTTFTIPNNAYSIHLGLTVYADVSNEKVYPMLRDVRISDSTYVPYTKTNRELTIETNSIAPMLNFYGSKNLYNLNGYSLISGFSINNTTISNAITDSYSSWMFYLYAIDAAGSSTRLYYEPISTIGLKEIPITVPNGTKYFRIFHSGGTTNFYLDVPFTEAGNFIFSMNVLGYNSTIVGGLSFTDVMIRDARISDSTFVPYAMTNRELTEKIENKGGNIIAIGSVPYYPPHNGIAVLHMIANQSQAGNHMLFLNKDSNRIATIASYITGWGAVDISFPMVKGSEYTVEQESGDPANVDWTHSYLYY